MKARIKNLVALSPAIKRITLEPADGGLFTAAAAGAHILLEIPGPERLWKNAYSLVSAPGHRASYDIIVRRVEHSRGGSAWLHSHAAIGQILETSLPVNLFPIAKSAQKHLLLSAGIGITPFIAYLPVLNTAPHSFELHHCCKPSEAAAFAGLLPEAGNITLHTSRATLDLASLLAGQNLSTHVYICGPESFIDAALAATQKFGWPAAKIHTESFGGATGGAPFRVRLAHSGRTLTVAEDTSLLETLEQAGLAPPYLCRGGVCGECELPVLEGVPEHHDHFLSAEQRAANKSIMACVSRARTPELVLDF